LQDKQLDNCARFVFIGLTFFGVDIEKKVG